MKRLLIANRGEIAIRVTEAAAELGLTTAAIFSEDDAKSLHVIRADEACQLRGAGAAAYLDGEQIMAVAQQAGCDAVHPGYGFLSENAGFARRCAEAGIVSVGPRPELLELFGDKVRARQLAGQCGVPVPAGSAGPTDLAEVKAFLQSGPADAAIAMSGGADDASVFTVSWPTGEFGPMALEGAAKLGYRNELAAIADPAERKKRFDDTVAGLYQRGKALNVATRFAIDDVIDPADSRRWISTALRSTPVPTRRTVKKYPFIDCW